MNRATPLPLPSADTVEPSPLDALLARPMHRPDLDHDDGSGGTEYVIRITLIDDDDDDDEPTEEEHTSDHLAAPALLSYVVLCAALLAATLMML